MKKSIFIVISVMVLVVAILAGRMLFRREAEPTAAFSAEQVVSQSEAVSEKIPPEADLDEVLSPTNVVMEEELPAEMANLLAKRILAAMTGGASAEAGALAPASLWDESVSLKLRRQLVWRFARSDDPADFQLLTEYLTSSDGDPRIQALILESLGESKNPEARKWVLSALDADDERIVCAALRGLAKMDHSADLALFSNFLLLTEASLGIRAEAAMALGTLTSTEAGEQLVAAYRTVGPGADVLREALINGLGQRDISETESFFREVLANETNAEHRLSIVETVSEAKGDTAPFLSDCLRDADSELRAEAAWNMGMLDGEHGDVLCEHLKTETDSEVRKRLYEALDDQEIIDVPLVLARSLQEEDVEVQLAAYTLVATRLDDIEDVAERKSAELELIGEFERMAVESETLNQRLRAVIGLRRMQTEGSGAALDRLIGQSTDPRVITATGIDLTELMKE